MMTRATGARATPAHDNQARAGMQKPESLHSLPFRQDLEFPPVVIPAKAGIQWLKQAIPA